MVDSIEGTGWSRRQVFPNIICTLHLTREGTERRVDSRERRWFKNSTIKLTTMIVIFK
jgi:hypothetical protein